MLAELNPAQREAVLCLHGPLLVLAGAGTGKTRVVTYRIAHLIKQGVPPAAILGVTFTNKAAREMQQRARTLVGRAGEQPEISTFHSLCVRILRRQIHHLGYPPSFAIYDRADQQSLAREVLREIKCPQAMLTPEALTSMIGRWKSLGINPQQAAARAVEDRQHAASAAYARYQRAMKLAGAVDFDDLLLLVVELFATRPEVRRCEAARYYHILVDEYQDTNPLQYQIVRALAAEHRNLCVVGDDDQSIYAFRGAEVTHILRFTQDWPEARVVRLEQNYRSTQAILDLANRLIVHNRRRHPKTLRAVRSAGVAPRLRVFESGEQEAAAVVSEMAARIFSRSAQPCDFAVLFRTNEQPRLFEQQLRRQRLPYVVVGAQSFFDRKEVRDVTAYLRVLVNPRDETALRRIISVPPRGIGARTLEALSDRAVAARQPLWEVLQAYAAQEGGEAAREAVRSFCDLIVRYRQRVQQQPPTAVVVELLSELRYEQHLERLYPQPLERQARWNSVQELIEALAAYEQQAERPSLAAIVDELALQQRDFQPNQGRESSANAVVLMTLHSAKGLEFPIVYMVGMEEGLLPHRHAVNAEGTAIDEERRLCYVGITRAQNELLLTMARTRPRGGKAVRTQPSRFLLELGFHVPMDDVEAVNPSRHPGRAARPARRGTP
jgi:DNA helicase-2/ATP-dependent DNA helicase PcrA